MLIKRQGKNGLVNFDNVTLIDTADDDEGCACVLVWCADDSKVILGQYENRERANAVLREIVKAYKTQMIIAEAYMVKTNVINFTIRAEKLTVYEMPEA